VATGAPAKGESNMKKKLLAVVSVSLSLLLGAVLVTSAAAAKDEFIGVWKATDSADGSDMTMRIGGGPQGDHMVRLHDDGASACGIDESGAPLYAGTARGSLSETDGQLTGDVYLFCKTAPPDFNGPYSVEFTYSDGMLLDNFGNTWYRVPYWGWPSP